MKAVFGGRRRRAITRLKFMDTMKVIEMRRSRQRSADSLERNANADSAGDYSHRRACVGANELDARHPSGWPVQLTWIRNGNFLIAWNPWFKKWAVTCCWHRG